MPVRNDTYHRLYYGRQKISIIQITELPPRIDHVSDLGHTLLPQIGYSGYASASIERITQKTRSEPPVALKPRSRKIKSEIPHAYGINSRDKSLGANLLAPLFELRPIDICPLGVQETYPVAQMAQTHPFILEMVQSVHCQEHSMKLTRRIIEVASADTTLTRYHLVQIALQPLVPFIPAYGNKISVVLDLQSFV